jgi:hypothetical protein
MSVLGIIVVCWLVLNAAIFAALLLRRPRSELRERLFRWIVQGRSRRAEKSRRRSRHSHV